uniref:Uncharacterized protein n=1 Tax=Caenorhabditis japonica TaxID=281687 RepID=A0A8R1IGN6_CAEJA
MYVSDVGYGRKRQKRQTSSPSSALISLRLFEELEAVRMTFLLSRKLAFLSVHCTPCSSIHSSPDLIGNVESNFWFSSRGETFHGVKIPFDASHPISIAQQE